jgi:serine/threonine protein kinase/tetratricopeptide (TPR) repeat protein
MPQTTNQPEHIVGRYEVIEELGAGGMGTVYRGTDTQTSQVVAIKLLRPDVVAADPDMVERFAREAEALRQLNHPNIVKVLDTAEENNHHYIIMEYVGGGSLRDLLSEQPQLPVKKAAGIALELADALTRAHHLKIIHRDLKPANILLAEDGTPRLTDFGVARIEAKERVTDTGSTIGTLDYLCPEGLNGEKVDARADIWAFGVTLFEMLAGRRPFMGESLAHVVMSIMTEATPDLEALRSDCPVALVDLIYRMLEKDRTARIPSIRLVGAELEAILHDTDIDTSSVRSAVKAILVDDVFAKPAAPTDTLKHNFPVQTTPFVGRENEIAELIKLMDDPNIRLVTIIAPGGMGKTRLSLETANTLIQRTTSISKQRSAHLQATLFSNGAYFVPLAPLAGSENILLTLADAVGYQFQSDGRERERQIMDFFREKRALLVFDNFEHVLDGASLVGAILEAAPEMKVLVTSRERLNLSAETVYNLGGMDFPDWRKPSDALEYSAVKLFMQSARRVRPGFEIQAQDLKAVARICQMAQGVPLAILLAAAWVEMLSPDEIVKEIEQSLDFLETEMRDVPERHRSMRAVFEYSWNLLAEDARELFKKLAVFRGGFTREAGQAVTGAGLRGLSGLVNKSLLRRDPNGRYEVHELLRQYAEARLVELSEMENKTRDAHSLYYAAFLQTREDALWSQNEKKALEEITAEIENVRAGWWWAIERGQFADMSKSLNALTVFSESQGLFREAVDILEQAAQRLESKPDGRNNPLLWQARAAQAWLGLRLGDSERLTRLTLEGLTVLKRLGRLEDTGFALDALGYAAMMSGQFPEARQYGEENVNIAEQLGDNRRRIRALANMGYAVFLQGSYEEARHIYYEVVEALVQSGSMSGLAYCSNNLGEICHAMREEEEANRCFERSLKIFRELGNRHGMAVVLNNLGNVAHFIGDYEAAKRHIGDSLTIYREIGDRRGLAEALNRLGNTHFVIAEYAEAQSLLRDALGVYRELTDKRGVAASLTLLGFLTVLLGDYPMARQYHEEALSLRRETGNPEDIADSLVHLCIANWQDGQFEEALAKVNESEAIIHATGLEMSPVIGLCISNRGMLATAMGNYEEAQQLLENAVAFHRKTGDPYGEAVSLDALGFAYLGLKNYAEALASFRESIKLAWSMNLLLWVMYGLPGIAAICARTDQPQRAAELFALARQHPATWHYSKTWIIPYLNELQQQLSSENFTAAMERGKALDIQQVVQEILT